ncbi:phage protein NinX family protein [Citrobacter sp. Marseille-Q6884]|uniref:phage protein NinX family protein n=1 Tax=Citrobacter sp. Marseille-Q6884 TaxID=2956786 RepID=UPI0021B3C666|nr:phage protein NinX family protein [Citrobacter sp. Marseille-Q6884]
MDYSKMSDFEINCVVLAVFSPDIEHMCLSADNSCFYDCGPSGDGWNQIDIPDYCNNPADAWPIIVERKINIEWHEWKNSEWKSYALNNATTKSYYDTNPLRAAMIVFLMMQELLNFPANSTGSDIR